MPQFPLGTVLFPTMLLPLHVFEPRYRVMIEDVQQDESSFGIVLIERGSEVGGGDTRTHFGTEAKIVEAQQLNDGRWAIVAAGVSRIRVDNWLVDDPYPQAEVTRWPDEDIADPAAAATIDERFEQLVASFTRCLALAAESGMNVGGFPQTFADVSLGTMQMAALAPLTAADKQALLGAPGASERIDMLDTMLNDAVELIQVRLSDP